MVAIDDAALLEYHLSKLAPFCGLTLSWLKWWKLEIVISYFYGSDNCKSMEGCKELAWLDVKPWKSMKKMEMKEFRSFELKY